MDQNQDEGKKLYSNDEVSIYDEGTKDYIKSNRLLDFASEFLWKTREKADRPVRVNGLNEIKPPFDYNTYYEGKVIRGRASVFGYVFPHEEKKIQALEREYMANPHTEKPIGGMPHLVNSISSPHKKASA